MVVAACGDGADATPTTLPTAVPPDAWTFTAVVDASDTASIFAVAWDGWFIEGAEGTVGGVGTIRGRALGECSSPGGTQVPYEYTLTGDFVVAGTRTGDEFEVVVTEEQRLEPLAQSDVDEAAICVAAVGKALGDVAAAGPGAGEPVIVAAERGTTPFGALPFAVRFILVPAADVPGSAAGA
jgi:hypothetical protein